jgi:hypothetical protein
MMAVRIMKEIKRELEGLYKTLIRILFNENPNQSETEVPKDSILPIERKINTLIMSIND